MSKKKKRSHYMFVNQEGQELFKYPGEIDGQMFMVDSCKGCKIFLYDHFDQVIIESVEDCEIFVGPSASSIFLRDAKNCSLVGAAKQVRISTSEK